jgi:hypothetical protein
LLVTSTFDFHNHEDISIQNTTNTMNKKREWLYLIILI